MSSEEYRQVTLKGRSCDLAALELRGSAITKHGKLFRLSLAAMTKDFGLDQARLLVDLTVRAFAAVAPTRKRCAGNWGQI